MSAVHLFNICYLHQQAAIAGEVTENSASAPTHWLWLVRSFVRSLAHAHIEGFLVNDIKFAED